jgi:pyruvate formate lyase activating enzyme
MTNDNPNTALNATLFQIQRMSTEDGPGIRTTIFFKGCSLRCAWCHNPEGISPKPQVCWVGNRCIGCKTCLDVCPDGALTFTEEGVAINRKVCSGCGLCAEECPSTAMELLGETRELEDLIAEAVKDTAYFQKSGGGVTIGGGEPAIQAQFAGDFLGSLREMGIHTATDTSGMCPRESLEALLPHTDLLLYDIKEIDPQRHRRFTHSGNARILENLMCVRDCMKSEGYPKELWIRTPVIPGATATEENIKGIGEFLTSRLDGFVSRWELCAFNNLCKDKYIRLDLDWKYKNCALLSRPFMEKIAAIARNSGVDPRIVRWSGSTKLTAS